MLTSFWNKLKEIIQKMVGTKTLESVVNVKPVISDKMLNAIVLWTAMYEDRSPWIREPQTGHPVRVASMGLPALIASEKARMATLEMESEINAPTVEIEEENPEYEPPSTEQDEMGNMKFSMGRGTPTIKKEVPVGSTERADFLDEQYTKLKKQLRRQIEYGIAKGGLVIKPYLILHEGFTPVSDEPTEPTDTAKQSNTQTGDKTQNPAKPVAKTNNNQATQNVSNKPDEGQKNGPQNNKKKDDKNSTAKEPIGNNEGTTNFNTGFTETDLSGNVNEQKRPKVAADIEFEFVQADGFYPLAFTAAGKITEAAFLQRLVNGEYIYTRIEHHKLENNVITVTNAAYKRKGDADELNTNGYIGANVEIGDEISLAEVPEWASIQPQVQIKDVDRLLFAYFKMPEANTIDPYSPLGVGCCSRVVRLIQDADMQYSRLLWEYEGGELAIDVDRYALNTEEIDRNGKRVAQQTVLPLLQERLFRKVDLNDETTYEPYAPSLRDTNYIQGLNRILMMIEDATGLSRGTLSEQPQSEAKTATELKILKERSYSTNKHIQDAIEDALRDVVYIMDVYCTLYKVVPEGEYEVSFEWDDSILVDAETELSKRLMLMQNGITSKLETRMWYFGETEPQAKLALQKVDDESKASQEQNMESQLQLSQAMGDNKNEDEDPDNKNSKVANNTNPDKGINTANQKKFGNGGNTYNNILQTGAAKKQNFQKK